MDADPNALQIVGIGGSAGSLAALQAFFENVPTDSGCAYVVVTHLSADHESLLAEVLQKSAAIPVNQVTSRLLVERDHVYVIPPGKRLAMIDGALAPIEVGNDRDRRYAVDHFFRTLADEHGEEATAIVLSGMDGDGAIGLARVKERGGATVAQDPDEAEHEGMPRSAVATGMVDFVLRAAEMPGRLAEFRQRARRIKLPDDDAPKSKPEDASAEVARDDEAALREVLSLLRQRTGHDFSSYKRGTVLRRIGRRMQVTGSETLVDYVAFLKKSASEAEALLRDLLIGVTNFFRDKETFDELASVIPDLFRGKGPEDCVRVWVPACATGEEAYSVAMLLREYASNLAGAPEIQVFATDIDESAIQKARLGVYQEAIAADISDERLRRFFSRESHGFQVRREIREIVLFAVHNVLRDSPFSRLDLVSCRNLLIYFNREAQSRAFDTFHFALRGEGLLLLGPSESAEEADDRFVATGKKHRLYRRRPVARPVLPVPTGTPSVGPILNPDFETKSDDLRLRERAMVRPDGMDATTWAETHFRMIEQLAPPSVLVTGAYDIVHISETAGRYLQVVSGEPTSNLMRVVKPELRTELRGALLTASQKKTSVDVRETVWIDGEARVIEIGVRVSPESGMELLLVIFREVGTDATSGATPGQSLPSLGENEVMRQLESENERGRGRLRAAVENYEAQTEELKASNEELQAMNEELRSATEELETGREELQSINEELTAVNQELKSKVGELSHTNSDLLNLMASTEIATIFLDRELRIKRYTPNMVSLFNLIATDLNRPLADLTHRLEYPEIGRDAEQVLQRLVPVEREVQDSGGRWFLTRMLPYRTTEDQIAGVVLTFVEITVRRRMEEELRKSRDELLVSLQETEAAREQMEAACEAKDHFLAVLSHELRTPLTPVLFAVGAMQAREDLSEESRSTFEMIRRNVALEASLIDDLLDVSRIGRGKLELACKKLDLNDVVSRAVEISRPDIDGRRQELTVSLSAQHPTIMGDSTRLQQAVWNLIKNASKFSAEGGRIGVTTRDDGSSLEIEVSDEGIGIDAGRLNAIFDPFSQASTDVTKTYGGLGLGLAIAKATIEAHGGTIRVESDGQGKGSRFFITLPMG